MKVEVLRDGKILVTPASNDSEITIKGALEEIVLSNLNEMAQAATTVVEAEPTPPEVTVAAQNVPQQEAELSPLLGPGEMALVMARLENMKNNPPQPVININNDNEEEEENSWPDGYFQEDEEADDNIPIQKGPSFQQPPQSVNKITDMTEDQLQKLRNRIAALGGKSSV